jgi:hypothetical protein
MTVQKFVTPLFFSTFLPAVPSALLALDFASSGAGEK